MCLQSHNAIRSQTNLPGMLTEDTFSIHQPCDPPPNLLVLTAAHCFEFITDDLLLYSHLLPSLCAPSAVPILSPRKSQSHLQSYSLSERHRETHVSSNTICSLATYQAKIYPPQPTDPEQQLHCCQSRSSSFALGFVGGSGNSAYCYLLSSSHRLHCLINYVHLFCHILYKFRGDHVASAHSSFPLFMAD